MLADVRALRAADAELGDETAGSRLFAGYLDQMLEVSFAPPARGDFGRELASYVRDQHRQCCYCGSPWPTAEWMAANVPEGIGVQIFSNRLLGGGRRDPKRRVCQLCRLQLILEKVAWANGGVNDEKQATFYLHLVLHSFFPASFLAAWREEVKRPRAEDHDAVFLGIPGYLRDWADRKVGPIKITYKSRKDKEDLMLPLPTPVGNTPVLVLNAQQRRRNRENPAEGLETRWHATMTCTRDLALAHSACKWSGSGRLRPAIIVVTRLALLWRDPGGPVP